MRTYKLAAAITNSDNIATVTVQRSGRIRSIRWSTTYTSNTSGHEADIELSMVPVNQIDTNDTIGVVDQISIFNFVGAVGQLDTGKQSQSLVDYPVAVGERLYLNATSTLTSGRVTCFVDVQEQ